MTIIVALLALFDAAIFPIKGILPSILFVLIIVLGIWRVRNYKNWFIMSLVFISLAVILYLIGGGIIDESLVHKLSDWSLIFLLLGAVQLARSSHAKNRI